MLVGEPEIMIIPQSVGQFPGLVEQEGRFGAFPDTLLDHAPVIRRLHPLLGRSAVAIIVIGGLDGGIVLRVSVIFDLRHGAEQGVSRLQLPGSRFFI